MAYVRKTKDEYQLISNYGYGEEVELTEDTLKEIKQRRFEYVSNCNTGTFKIRKVRIKLGGQN